MQKDVVIYKQAAIDALVKAIREDPYYDSNEAINGLGICDVRVILNDLPSAQQEIVRCKDCKHYGCVLYSGTQFEYGECFGHEESHYTFEVKPDDFCSRAERRTDG